MIARLAIGAESLEALAFGGFANRAAAGGSGKVGPEVFRGGNLAAVERTGIDFGVVGIGGNTIFKLKGSIGRQRGRTSPGALLLIFS